MITRRNLLVSMLAAGVAPAFVRSESLMALPVPKKVWVSASIDVAGTYFIDSWSHSGDLADFRIPKISLRKWIYTGISFPPLTPNGGFILGPPSMDMRKFGDMS